MSSDTCFTKYSAYRTTLRRVPQILNGMRSLGNCERSSHPTVPISDLTLAIRRRYGYCSVGAMILALHRLKIDLRALSRLEVFAAIRSEWVEKQRGTDRSFVRARPISRSSAGSVEPDRYSHHPGQPVPIASALGRGSLESFWFDCWEETTQ